MCEKPDFDRAQNEATQLLLKQSIHGLYIDVRTFVFDRRIQIDSIQHYSALVNRPTSDFICDRFRGCCVIPHSRCNLVLFDESEPNDCRKHWGITHEIGHIYLNHKSDGEKEEKEAHFFAAQIVMPEIVMVNVGDRCNGLFPREISETFNASYESACRRVGTFQRRFGFSSSKEDKMLLAKFRPIWDEAFPQERQKQFWDQLCLA